MTEQHSPGKKDTIEKFTPLRRFWRVDDEDWVRNRETEWEILKASHPDSISTDYLKAYFLRGEEPPSSILLQGDDEPIPIKFTLRDRFLNFPFYSKEDVENYINFSLSVDKFDREIHALAREIPYYYRNFGDVDERSKRIMGAFYNERFVGDRIPINIYGESVAIKPEQFYRLFLGAIYNLVKPERLPVIWQFYAQEYFEMVLPAAHKILSSLSSRSAKTYIKNFDNLAENYMFIEPEKLNGRYLYLYNYISDHLQSNQAPEILKEAFYRHSKM